MAFLALVVHFHAITLTPSFDMQRASFSLSSLLKVLLAFAHMRDVVDAYCTSWTDGRTDVHSFEWGWSTRYKQSVETIECPPGTQHCRFAAEKIYNITVERDLYTTVDMPLIVPDEEKDAIFQLAQAFFNRGKNVSHDFMTIRTNVSSATSYVPPSFLDIPPAIRKSLNWNSFYLYSTGVLGGCSNESLNGMTVTAATPYYTKSVYRANQTVLAGSWSTGSFNTTRDEETSGAGSLIITFSISIGIVLTSAVIVMA